MKLDMRQYADLFYEAAVEVARRGQKDLIADQLFRLAYAACKKAKYTSRMLDIAHYFNGKIYLLDSSTMFLGEFMDTSLERFNHNLAEISEDVPFVRIRNDAVEGIVKSSLEGKFLEICPVSCVA